MKKISLILLAICCMSCAQLQQVANNLPGYGFGNLTQEEIGNGLKSALKKGVSEQVSKLTKTDGFYKNPLVKIMLPEELQKVESGLRKIGLGSLADEGIKYLNRAAEDAVAQATPIFVDAITSMSFADAKNILLGDQDAATTYLKGQTSQELYRQFKPQINASFKKVGAAKIWENIITKYNSIPFTNTVNPDLTDYVTQQALEGVYTMIAKEELKIRENVGARSTKLLQKVFALQDGQ